MKRYDVFLSYNRKDERRVKQIANELKDAGIRVWIDIWELKPGRSWLDALHFGIRESSSIVVCVGASGVGPWETAEVRDALEQGIKGGCPVIPLLLPGAKKKLKLPPFLNQFTWVDCRSTQTSQESLDKLIWGITGRRPARSISQIGEEFRLKLQRPDKTERDVEIYPLPNPRSGLLHLSWETFGKGIERLQFQIENYGRRLHFDACFGINDAGLVMATFLNSSTMGRVKIGYIRYKGIDEGSIVSDDDSFFPELRAKPTIMLVDYEVKTAGNLKISVDRIRQEYKGAKVYFAVFGALAESNDLRVGYFDELKAAQNIKALEIEDLFIACTMTQPGIEPPLRLR